MTENKTMTLSAHDGLIAALAVSTVNGLVASASHDRFVKLWKWPWPGRCTVVVQYNVVFFFLQVLIITCMYFIPLLCFWFLLHPPTSLFFYVTIESNLCNIITILVYFGDSCFCILKLDIIILLCTFFPLISN